LSHYITTLLENVGQIDKENEYVLFHRDNSSNPIYDNFEHIEYGRYMPSHIPSFIAWEIAFLRALRRSPVDVLHSPDVPGLPLLSNAPKNVVTFHDAGPFLYPAHYSLKGHASWRTRAPIALRRADAVIADTNSAKSEICGVFPYLCAKIKVIYLGITPDFHPQSEGKTEEVLQRLGISRPYILMHTMHRWNKNTLGALKIFYDARQAAGMKEFALVLSGGMPDDLCDRVKHMAASLGVADNVVVTGWINDSDVPYLMSGAYAMLYPSLHEGFGLPVLEAMMCGTPVVALCIPVLAEVLGNAGVYGPNMEMLSARLAEMMADQSMKLYFSARSLRNSMKFSAKEMALETVAVYSEVAG